MLRRWHVLLLVLVTLAALCGLAAVKLRATPKYDRIQMGMTFPEVKRVLGKYRGEELGSGGGAVDWLTDEGSIRVWFRFMLPGDVFGAILGVQGPVDPEAWVVEGKQLEPCGPLERLAWLTGWR